MKLLQQYRIPFTGLKIGKHQFEFEVDDRFFDEFEYSLVKKGKLAVFMEMDKQETMLILDFRITGTMFLSCDVCLGDYPFMVDCSERQIAKFGTAEEEDDDTEEIILVGRNEHEIDVSSLIYEYINLAVPYINRCGDEGNTEWCDKEMIRKLRSLSVNEADQAGSEEDENKEGDPRWEALKKIKNK